MRLEQHARTAQLVEAPARCLHRQDGVDFIFTRADATAHHGHVDRGQCHAAAPKTMMIDATYLKAHRTATSLRVKKGGAVG